MLISLLPGQQKRCVFREKTEREASEDKHLLVCEQFNFFLYCLTKKKKKPDHIKNSHLQNDRRVREYSSWVIKPLCSSSHQLTWKGKLCVQMTRLWLQQQRSSR